MAEFRNVVATEAGDGVVFEIHEFARKTHVSPAPAAPPAGAAGAQLRVVHMPSVARVSRQIRIALTGGAVLLEPGAFQYSHGRITAEVQKNARAGGFLQRRVLAAGAGESAFATRFSGHGEVWTEPTQKYFIAARMDGPGDALLLDDQAFYACEATVEVSTHVHASMQGLLSGNGLMQPKLSGRGAFVVESPVPVEEIVEVTLDGSDELVVDGDLMLMYSASLQVKLQPLVRGLRNILRSGEGLVFVISGKGSVWLTPTVSIGI